MWVVMSDTKIYYNPFSFFQSFLAYRWTDAQWSVSRMRMRLNIMQLSLRVARWFSTHQEPYIVPMLNAQWWIFPSEDWINFRVVWERMSKRKGVEGCELSWKTQMRVYIIFNLGCPVMSHKRGIFSPVAHLSVWYEMCPETFTLFAYCFVQ
jgi:hypothetical protein